MNAAKKMPVGGHGQRGYEHYSTSDTTNAITTTADMLTSIAFVEVAACPR